MVILYDHILKHVQHYQRSNSQDTKLLINVSWLEGNGKRD